MVSPAINQLMPLLYISCKIRMFLVGTERAPLLQRQGMRFVFPTKSNRVSHILLEIFSTWVLLENKAYCDLNLGDNASHHVGIRAVFSEVHEVQPRKPVRSAQPRSQEVWGSSQGCYNLFAKLSHFLITGAIWKYWLFFLRTLYSSSNASSWQNIE